ncbi:MAG: hypothetical protein CVT88_00315 [Candidatus Altiarchaeales archaeon HGW-Altiarchaeales-1]|nr:MAG: hypothetical protein CVT88_00315 [Candidatus Altiarchaeales archaeon HGW-Altiarchaeales-1]
MDFIPIKIDEEIVNGLEHFTEWTSLGKIALSLRITYPKAERVCWTLAGKDILLWKPGKERQQLFKYNRQTIKKKEVNILSGIDKLLMRNYYITGESALFLHGLTDHAMYQRKIDIALPKNKYNMLAGRIVENLSKFATILPYEIPKHCNKNKIITDALTRGYAIIIRKSSHNIRKLKFNGDLNLPDIEIILEEIDFPKNDLFEYTMKALDYGMTNDEFEKLCEKKPNLYYLKKYFDGDKNIPVNILKIIKKSGKNVRGY